MIKRESSNLSSIEAREINIKRPQMQKLTIYFDGYSKE